MGLLSGKTFGGHNSIAAYHETRLKTLPVPMTKSKNVFDNKVPKKPKGP